MSFKEAGKQENKKGPLERDWSRLQDYKCPMCDCEDLLTYFEHIELWKCGCGFKISNNKLRTILSNIDEKDFNSGFRYGNYDDEPPF